MLAALARLFLDAVAPGDAPVATPYPIKSICADCGARMSAMPVPPVRRMRHGSGFAAFEFVEPVRAALHRGKYGGDRQALC